MIYETKEKIHTYVRNKTSTQPAYCNPIEKNNKSTENNYLSGQKSQRSLISHIFQSFPIFHRLMIQIVKAQKKKKKNK